MLRAQRSLPRGGGRVSTACRRAHGTAGIAGRVLGRVLSAAAGASGLRARGRGATSPMLLAAARKGTCRRRRLRPVDAAAVRVEGVVLLMLDAQRPR